MLPTLQHVFLMAYDDGSQGCNVNAFHCGATALMMAAASNHLEVMAFLIEHGADVKIRSHLGKPAQAKLHPPGLYFSIV